MDTKAVDQNKTEAFAERCLQILNDSALSMMFSIGHRTGLFDVLATTDPATSQEIADQAKLNERYVREWLGSMVTGQIINYDPQSQKYVLPKEHAVLLTRAASPDNLAVTMQWVSVLAGVEDKIVECFQKGGGVPYEAYPRFHEVMAEESAQTVVAMLDKAILPLVPGLVDRMRAGIDVCDIGCGSGRAIIQMAQSYPESRFVGYDFSEEGIAAANALAERLGLSNARFEVKDVAQLDEANAFDLITAFDAIHDQMKPDRVLHGIAQALRPDGTFLMQDIAGTSHVDQDIENPIGPLLYTISCMHCMTVSMAQGGAALGAMWGKDTAQKMLIEAGFTNVDIKQLSHDFINYYYIVTKNGAV